MTKWLDGEIHANGINIHYYRSNSGNKPPLLLLHGVTDSGLCWPQVAQDLEGSYDVIMTDARGHGHSGASADFSTALLADDAAAVIRELKLEKPAVWGHSMGAITTALLAANYADLVRAVVLEDPPFKKEHPLQIHEEKLQSGTNEERQSLRGWQWLFDLRALAREERIARGFTLNPTWAKEEIMPWADSKAELNTGILGLALADVPRIQWREVIANIKCPVLLITGDPELGAIVTPEVAQEATQLWKNGEVAYLDGAGHNIHRERYDGTMRAVRDFLDRA